jgi:hypothetical protein
LEEAKALLEEALTINRAIGSRWGEAISLHHLGELAMARGEHTIAHAMLAGSLTIRRELHDPDIDLSLEAFGRLAVSRGQSVRAVHLFGAAAARREAMEWTAPSHPAADERSLATLRTALGEQSFATAWAAGRALSLGEAIAYALKDGSYENPVRTC